MPITNKKFRSRTISSMLVLNELYFLSRIIAPPIIKFTPMYPRFKNINFGLYPGELSDDY